MGTAHAVAPTVVASSPIALTVSEYLSDVSHLVTTLRTMPAGDNGRKLKRALINALEDVAVESGRALPLDYSEVHRRVLAGDLYSATLTVGRSHPPTILRHMTDVVARAAELLAIQSSTGAEGPAVDFVARWLIAHGWNVTTQEVSKGRANVWASRAGGGVTVSTHLATG